MPDYKIILPSKPRVVSEEGNKGVFEIDGLYPGYGYTLGNSLRRIILSSLEDDKAEDILALDIRGKSSFADMLVIASGKNTPEATARVEVFVEDDKKLVCVAM